MGQPIVIPPKPTELDLIHRKGTKTFRIRPDIREWNHTRMGPDTEMGQNVLSEQTQ